MSRAVRVFVVWVMVLAVPLQGWAASLMISCGPSHARMMLGLVAASADAGDHGHGAASHDHADHTAHAASGMGHEGGAAAAVEHAEHTCSACAACCAWLALPMRFSLPASSGLVHPMHSVLPAPRPSHQPGGLDRPPRASFA